MTAEVESIFPDEPGTDQGNGDSYASASAGGPAQGQSAGPAAAAPQAPTSPKVKGRSALPFHPKFLVMGLIFAAICVFAFRDQLFGADQPSTLVQGSPEFAGNPVQQPAPSVPPAPPATAPARSVAATVPTAASSVAPDEPGWTDTPAVDTRPAKDAEGSPEGQESGWGESSPAAAPGAPRHDRKSAREVALAEDLYQANKRADDAVIKFNQVSDEIEKLKSAMQALEKKVASLPAAAPATAKPKAAAPVSPKPAAQVAKRAPPAAKQAAFRINTIYPDQAWVDKGDRTYIVQVGDVLEGARVLRIDTTARRIVTTAGEIR